MPTVLEIPTMSLLQKLRDGSPAPHCSYLPPTAGLRH